LLKQNHRKIFGTFPEYIEYRRGKNHETMSADIIKLGRKTNTTPAIRQITRTIRLLGMVSLFFVMTLCAARLITAHAKQLEKGGDTVDGGTYKNPELGMSIDLPGRCDGPLCGYPQIVVSRASTSETSQKISMIAYQLSGPYLDRKRYPLKWYAEGMTKESLGRSTWMPDGDLTSISLGGKSAYPLLVRHQASSQVGFGYVAESHGYMFLLIGTANSGDENLRSAIERMTFSNPC
jgi:hypothetical protein